MKLPALLKFVCFVVLLYPIYRAGYALGNNRAHEQIAAKWNEWFGDAEEKDESLDDLFGPTPAMRVPVPEVDDPFAPTPSQPSEITPAERAPESGLDDLFG